MAKTEAFHFFPTRTTLPLSESMIHIAVIHTYTRAHVNITHYACTFLCFPRVRSDCKTSGASGGFGLGVKCSDVNVSLAAFARDSRSCCRVVVRPLDANSPCVSHYAARRLPAHRSTRWLGDFRIRTGSFAGLCR